MFPCQKGNAVAKHSHWTTVRRRTFDKCRHFITDFIFKHRVWRLSCRPPQRGKRSQRQILRSVQRSALLPLRLPITFLEFIQTNQEQSFVKIKPITKRLLCVSFWCGRTDCSQNVTFFRQRHSAMYDHTNLSQLLRFCAALARFRYFKNHRIIHEYAKYLWDKLVTIPVSTIVINLKYIFVCDQPMIPSKCLIKTVPVERSSSFALVSK